MTHDFPKIRYLQITQIPFVRLDEGVLTDSAWARNLKHLAASTCPIRVVAPEVPQRETLRKKVVNPTIIYPDSGITYVGIPPLSSSFDYFTLAKIRGILHQEVMQADFIESSNFSPPYLGLLYAHKLAVSHRKKTSFVIHEDLYDELYWEWNSPKLNPFEKWLKSKILAHMKNRVLAAASSASLTFLYSPSASSTLRFDNPNCVVLRNVTHQAEDVISQEDFKRKCHDIVSGIPLQIITTSSHHPIKGLDFLIRAVAQLKKQGIWVTVKLYGEGPESAELKTLAAYLNIADRIVFPGMLPHGKEVFKMIGKAHISVMPHRSDNFEGAFYDAMAGATPVVAFQNPASAEILRDNVDSVLVPLDNVIALSLAIEQLHHNRSRLVELSTAARERALAETQRIWQEYRAERIKELFVRGTL